MICTTWETPSVGSITLLLLQISFSLLLEFFSFNPVAIWAFGIPDFSVARIAKRTQNTPGVTRKVLGPRRWSRWRPENLLHPYSSLLHLHPFLHCWSWFSWSLQTWISCWWVCCSPGCSSCTRWRRTISSTANFSWLSLFWWTGQTDVEITDTCRATSCLRGLKMVLLKSSGHNKKLVTRLLTLYSSQSRLVEVATIVTSWNVGLKKNI